MQITIKKIVLILVLLFVGGIFYCTIIIRSLSYSRSKVNIIWQGGSTIPQLINTRCLAQERSFTHVQTFRFDKIAKELENNKDKSYYNNKTRCGDTVKIIMYVGPTRSQFERNTDNFLWMRDNFELYKRHKSTLERIFGVGNIILQIFDEPQTEEDILSINMFCTNYKDDTLFLSINNLGLELLKDLSLDCLDLIDYHSYKISQDNSLLFILHYVLFSFRVNFYGPLENSVTLPLFIKHRPDSRPVLRSFSKVTYLLMKNLLGARLSYYGAYLNPNVGFLQDEKLYKVFMSHTNEL